MNRRTDRGRRPVAWCLVLCLACGIGLALLQYRPTFGEIQERTPKVTFQSGGARSEIVLLGIARTLERIDARLERIEKEISKRGIATGQAR